MVFFFFFFKQKTAYEMRISDWSSDVCSSDLLIHGAFALREQEVMLIVLGLIDVVMISNLLVMVIVGGYETFVSRLGLQGHPDQPEWLNHRSEEHTSELQSLMRISYAVFCLKNKIQT